MFCLSPVAVWLYVYAAQHRSNRQTVADALCVDYMRR